MEGSLRAKTSSIRPVASIQYWLVTDGRATTAYTASRGKTLWSVSISALSTRVSCALLHKTVVSTWLTRVPKRHTNTQATKRATFVETARIYRNSLRTAGGAR